MLFQFHTGKADNDLETALKALPPRCRSAIIRQALRWYLLPNGGQEIVQRLEAIESLLQVLQAHRPASPAASPKPSPPAAQQEQEQANAAAILAAFGDAGGSPNSMA